jgi:hypothetical protein
MQAQQQNSKEIIESKTMDYVLEELVWSVLQERISKFHRVDFPEHDLNRYALHFAERLEARILNKNSIPHRLVADLAIIASQIAHAFDKDEN